MKSGENTTKMAQKWHLLYLLRDSASPGAVVAVDNSLGDPRTCSGIHLCWSVGPFDGASGDDIGRSCLVAEWSLCHFLISQHAIFGSNQQSTYGRVVDNNDVFILSSVLQVVLVLTKLILGDKSDKRMLLSIHQMPSNAHFVRSSHRFLLAEVRFASQGLCVCFCLCVCERLRWKKGMACRITDS